MSRNAAASANIATYHPFRPAGSSIIAGPSTPIPSTFEAAGLEQAPPSSQKQAPVTKRGRRGKKRASQGQQDQSVAATSPTRLPTASNAQRTQQHRPSLPAPPPAASSRLDTLSSTQQSDLDFGGAAPPSQSTPTQRGKYYAGLMTSFQQKVSGSSGRPPPAAASPVLSEGRRSEALHGKSRKAGSKRKRAALKKDKLLPAKQHKAKSHKAHKARAKSRSHNDHSSRRGRSKSRGRSASKARSQSRAVRSSSKRRRPARLSDSDDSASHSESGSDTDSSGWTSGTESASETDSSSEMSESGDSSDEEIPKRSRKRARTDDVTQGTLVTFWLKSAGWQFERVLDSSLTLASAKGQVRAKFAIPAQSSFKLMCESSLGGQVMLDDEDDMKAFKLRATRSTAESTVISVLLDKTASDQQSDSAPQQHAAVADTALTATNAPHVNAPQASLSEGRATGSQGQDGAPPDISDVPEPTSADNTGGPQPAPAAVALSPPRGPATQTGTTMATLSPSQHANQTDEWVPPSIIARRREAALKAQDADNQPEPPSRSIRLQQAAQTPNGIAPSQAVEEVAQQLRAEGRTPSELAPQEGTETSWVLEQVSKGHPCGICGAKPWHGSYLCPTLEQGGLPFAERRMQELIDMKQRKKEHERTALRDLRSWVSVVKTGGQAGEKVLPTGEVTVGSIDENSHEQVSVAPEPSGSLSRRTKKRKQQPEEGQEVEDDGANKLQTEKEARPNADKRTIVTVISGREPPNVEPNAGQAASGTRTRKKPGPKPGSKPKNDRRQAISIEASDRTTGKQPAPELGHAQPKANVTVEDNIPAKKKRGRPPKKPQPEAAPSDNRASTGSAKDQPAYQPEPSQSESSPPSRQQQEVTLSEGNDLTRETPAKRIPGRPRKNPLPQDDATVRPAAKAGTPASNAADKDATRKEDPADQTQTPTQKQGAKVRGRKSGKAADRRVPPRSDDEVGESEGGAHRPLSPDQASASTAERRRKGLPVTLPTQAQGKASTSAGLEELPAKEANPADRDACSQTHAQESGPEDTAMQEALFEDSAAVDKSDRGNSRESPRAQRANRRQAESARADDAEGRGELAESTQEMEAIKERWAKVRKDCDAARKKVEEYLRLQAVGETFTSGRQGGFTRGKNMLIRCAGELEEVESEMSDFSSTHGVRRPPKAPELEAALALRNTLVKQVAQGKGTPRKSVQPTATKAQKSSSKEDDDQPRGARSPEQSVSNSPAKTPRQAAHHSSSAAVFNASQTPGLRSRQSSSEDDVETSPLLRSVGEPQGGDGVEAAAAEDNIPSQPLPPAVTMSREDKDVSGATDGTDGVEVSGDHTRTGSVEGTAVKPTPSLAAENDKNARGNSDDGDSDTSDDSDEDDAGGESESNSGSSSSSNSSSTHSESDVDETSSMRGTANRDTIASDHEEEEDEIVDSQPATAPATVEDRVESGDGSSSSPSPSSPSPSSAISSRTQSVSPARDAIGGEMDADASTTLQSGEADPISSFSGQASSPGKSGSNASTPLSRPNGSNKNGGGGSSSFFSPLNFFQAGRSMGNPFASSQPQGQPAGSQGSPGRGSAAPSSQPTAGKRSRLGMPRLSELDASMLRRRNQSANGAANGSGTSTPNSINGLLSPATSGAGGGSGNHTGFPFTSSHQQRESGDDEVPDAGADGGSEASDDESASGSESSDSDSDSDSDAETKKRGAAKSSLPANKMAASQDGQKKKRRRGLAALF